MVYLSAILLISVTGTVDSSLPKVVLSKDNDWFAVWEDSVSPENSEVFFTKEVVQSVK